MNEVDTPLGAGETAPAEVRAKRSPPWWAA